MQLKSYLPEFEMLQNEAVCHGCGGSGEGWADGTSCRVCKGIGSLIILTDDEAQDDGDAAYDRWNEEERAP